MITFKYNTPVGEERRVEVRRLAALLYHHLELQYPVKVIFAPSALMDYEGCAASFIDYMWERRDGRLVIGRLSKPHHRIEIKNKRDFNVLVEVLAHEFRHLYQDEYKVHNATKAEQEADAREYASTFVEAYKQRRQS